MKKFFFVALVFTILRFAAFSGIAPSDETTYTRYAAKVALGNFELPTPEDPHHGILRYTVVLPLAAAYYLFGINDFSTVLIFGLYAFLCLFTFYLFCRELFDEKVAFWSSFLLAVCPVHVVISFRAYADTAQLAFQFASWALLIRSIRNEKLRPCLLVASGACSYLAFNTNGSSLLSLIVFPALIFCLLPKNYLSQLKAAGLAAVGFVGAFLPVFFFNWAKSGHVLIELKSREWLVSLIQRNTPIGIKGFWEKIFSDHYAYKLFGFAESLLNDFFVLGQTVSFALLAYFFFKRPPMESLQKYRKGFTLLLVVFCSLYLSYEFVSYALMRKLPRYFYVQPVLLLIPMGVLLSIVSKRVKAFSQSTCLIPACAVVAFLGAWLSFDLLWSVRSFQILSWFALALLIWILVGKRSLGSRYASLGVLALFFAMGGVSSSKNAVGFNFIFGKERAERFREPALFVKDLLGEFREYPSKIYVSKTRWFLALNYYFEYFRPYDAKVGGEQDSILGKVTLDNIDKLEDGLVIIDNPLKSYVQSLVTNDDFISVRKIPSNWVLLNYYPITGISVYGINSEAASLELSPKYQDIARQFLNLSREARFPVVEPGFQILESKIKRTVKIGNERFANLWIRMDHPAKKRLRLWIDGAEFRVNTADHHAMGILLPVQFLETNDLLEELDVHVHDPKTVRLTEPFKVDFSQL